MEKVLAYCKNQSLENKVIINIFINIALILLIAIGGIHMISSAYSSQLYRAVAGNLAISAHTISDSLKQLENLSVTIYSSPTVQNSLDQIRTVHTSIVFSNRYRLLNRFLTNYHETYKQNGVSCIALYNPYFSNASDSLVIKQTAPAILERAVSQAEEAEGRIVWTIDPERETAILSRNVRKIDHLSLESLGNLLIFVDLDQIVTSANRAFSDYSDSGYLISDGERLIYQSDSFADDDAAYFFSRSTAPYQIIRYGQSSYFTIRDTIPAYDWPFVNLIPYNQIARSIHTTYFLVFLIFLCGTAFAFLFAKRTTRYILKDFKNLARKMEHFSRSELQLLQTDTDYTKRTDEISHLHQQFDSMALQIHDLVQKNYVNQILKREAQLKALEYQINPHFLYNTLQSISWRAKALKDPQISSMVESLGTLLRSTLSNKKSLVTLEYEKNLAECYMTIQKIRFADRLDFRFDCADSLKEYLVPSFSLQPLLENAIHYGMEECLDVCQIIVCAYLSDGNLHIKVANEGSSFEDDLLNKLEEGKRESHGFGIGLTNINQRIQILFGSQYGLRVYNEEDMAVVMITLPCQKEDTAYAEDDNCG